MTRKNLLIGLLVLLCIILAILLAGNITQKGVDAVSNSNLSPTTTNGERL